GAEINHAALRRPREGVTFSPRGLAPPDDLAARADCRRLAISAAEGAEINHPRCLGPRERMRCRVTAHVAVADDLAAGANRRGVAIAATESAEINGDIGRTRCACSANEDEDGHGQRSCEHRQTPEGPYEEGAS